MKRLKVKHILVVIAIVFIVLLYFYVTHLINTSVDCTQIDVIRKQQISARTFILASDIDATTPTSVKYRVLSSGDLVIAYGTKNTLKINRTELKDAYFMQDLGKIGITIKQHVTKSGEVLYKVEYWGTEVEQYVK